MEYLLQIKNLKTIFQSKKSSFAAVNDVSFEIEKGKILGIVGESGSGKSITMKSIMGILPPNATLSAGEIIFEGQNIEKLPENQKLKYRGKEISMIFQDPMTALNPLHTIGFQLQEILIRHKKLDKKTAQKESCAALEMVGISSPESRLKQYPHEFSGGMRQRVMIAMALACGPKLLIADEPTTALDVTIQAQILDLIQSLQKKTGMGVILITHDLGVVAKLCDEIIVLYGGRVMEQGNVEDIFYSPKHPYTKALLKSIPKLDNDDKSKLTPIRGTAPNHSDLLLGCPFAERCDFAGDACHLTSPPMRELGERRRVACFKEGFDE